MSRGILIAVCGLHAGAGTTTTARLLAEHLVQGARSGSVLLTSARGPDSAAALDGALARHCVVVADAGTLDAAVDVLPLASAVVWTVRLAAGLPTLPPATATSARTVVAVVGGRDAAAVRRVVCALPLSTRAAVIVPPPPTRDTEEHDRTVSASLLQALA